MAARARNRRPQSPGHEYRFFGLTLVELVGYLLFVALCVAVGWGLVVVT